jgi:cytochrome c peroxidase
MTGPCADGHARHSLLELLPAEHDDLMRNPWFPAASAALWLLFLALSAAGATRLAPDPPQPAPETSRIALGRRLFFAPELSRDGSTSCASCHAPASAYADGLPVAPGGARNTPTLLGVVEWRRFTWADPSVTTLEVAVTRPLQRPEELGSWGSAAVLARLRADPALWAAFRRAFPDADDPATWEHIAASLAAFVRTLRVEPGPYDRFLAGDAAALTPPARRGQRLFVEVGCANCHAGPALTNESYHSLGLDGAGQGDPGLAAHTGRPSDWGRFRVPSLRAVAQTAPYFHDGSAATLADVLAVYADGGRPAGRANPVRSGAMGTILLTEQDKRDLIAFLESL